MTKKISEIEFTNSNKIIPELTTLIKFQINKSLEYDIYEDNLRKLKTEIKKSKQENYKNVADRIITENNDKEKRLVVLSTQAERQTIQMRQE